MPVRIKFRTWSRDTVRHCDCRDLKSPQRKRPSHTSFEELNLHRSGKICKIAACKYMQAILNSKSHETLLFLSSHPILDCGVLCFRNPRSCRLATGYATRAAIAVVVSGTRSTLSGKGRAHWKLLGRKRVTVLWCDCYRGSCRSGELLALRLHKKSGLVCFALSTQASGGGRDDERWSCNFPATTKTTLFEN